MEIINCNNNWIILLFIFIFSISIGSFLNVLIYRIPNNINIFYPPSRCPVCNTPIKPWHNIPIIGWLVLKGKCHSCGAEISIQYPLIELATGIIGITVFLLNGCSIYSLTTFFVFSMLLAMSMIDFKYKAVPDSLNIFAFLFAIFSSSNFLDNFFCALMATGFMFIIKFIISSIKGEESLGDADILIAGTMGALLGCFHAFYALFFSAIFALPVMFYYLTKKEEKELPFVPFLFLGTFTEWIIIKTGISLFV